VRREWEVHVPTSAARSASGVDIQLLRKLKRYLDDPRQNNEINYSRSSKLFQKIPGKIHRVLGKKDRRYPFSQDRV